ncbi:MAG: alpha-L-rhamnosidase N-terminal domain-containing protein [Candidatus Hydrogenedentes bacterium]|nr:alpha-L-rhamnosidase N-terminal domain-containing protein [Candidatus Hydrogenedentota bacterium]
MKRICSFWLITMLLASYAPAGEPTSSSAAMTLQNSMVWLDSAPAGKQVWVAFRKTFPLDSTPSTAVLRLFADTRYILWVNGQYVDRGPCRFDPLAPEYDELDVTSKLVAGTNSIVVLVQHIHDGKPKETPEGFYGRAMRHVPGLSAQLLATDAQGKRTEVLTDTTWRVSADTQFLPGRIDWAGAMDDVDARKATADWTLTSFDDSSWKLASPVDGKQWGNLHPRHIPLLREAKLSNLTVLECGESKERKLVANSLPMDLKAGERTVVDANQFVQAYSILGFEAEEGARLEIEYAQTYFTSGNNPANSNGHVNTYIARGGRQAYMSTDTYGFKYLVVRVTSGSVQLQNVEIVNRLYPFDVAGQFASSDPLLDKLWQIGVNTVLACSEDSYVDCATRERVEWLGDAAVDEYPITRSVFSGPGVNGPRYADPRLIHNALWHIAISQQPDGRVKAHHPSDRWDIHGYIEDYSCLWIHSIREYYDSTNGLEYPDEGLAFVRQVWPYVTKQLQWFLDHRTERGLVKAREFVFPGNPLCYKVCEGASLNAYIFGALNDAAYLADALGDVEKRDSYKSAADSIRNALTAQLWNPEIGAYFGSIADDGSKTPPTVHAAIIALYFDAVPAESRARLEQWLFENESKESVSSYVHVFLFEDLYRMNNDKADQLVLDLIRTRWKAMSESETGTGWENFGPGEYCHNMGSAPTLFLSRYVLGVRVDGPIKNRHIVIEPRLGDLTEAKGVVVTEFGPVPVMWKRDKESGSLHFEVSIPKNTTASLSLPVASGDEQLILNGGAPPASEISRKGRRLAVTLTGGDYKGTLTPQK